MLITLGFAKRKPGTTHEEFCTHWREIHGPLVANHPEAKRYLKRYVQHHLSPSIGFGQPEALEFDGFSEAWYESADARKAFHAHPYFQNQVIADENLFIDVNGLRVLMFDSQVVQVGPDIATILGSERYP